MPRDFLSGAQDHYDVIVIGSGLAGLTSANILARQGRSVLLLEQHYKLGGMATWFKRPGGHIFDISLHGFPVRHGEELPALLVSRRSPTASSNSTGVRFDNPMFSLWTSFTREDFTKQLIEEVPGVEPENGQRLLRQGPRDELLRRTVR